MVSSHQTAVTTNGRNSLHSPCFVGSLEALMWQTPSLSPGRPPQAGRHQPNNNRCMVSFSPVNQELPSRHWEERARKWFGRDKEPHWRKGFEEMALKMTSMDTQRVARERARATVLNTRGTVCKGPMDPPVHWLVPKQRINEFVGVEILSTLRAGFGGLQHPAALDSKC